ncbi:ATP-binding response regulator [Actinomadura hibisca]|uniref:ATP-binding response regulator n=1 Tax=Actinomadura hibisca TaxID=68565 RepID=UPI0008325CBC|nr:ATP-binding protein [Actinomadura hibisca]
MEHRLRRFEIRDVDDIFTVRRAARETAAALRLDTSDQVRMATAVSELGRELIASGAPVVSFVVVTAPRPALVVEFEFGAPAGARPPGEGTAAAARLVDSVEERTAGQGDGRRTVVRLRKETPPEVPAPDEAALTGIRATLTKLMPVSAIEELRAQNAELIDALEDIRRQREDLRVLNAELEETNQGVLALYNQLSDELEETNRGVVALYAELDDKGQQLREVAEARTRFWSNVSHELRTPVNSVIGLARLLLDGSADPLSGEQHHQVEMIADSGHTLLSLVNELLDFAKAERGGLVPQLADTDLRAVLDQIAAQLGPAAAEAGITLDIGLPPGALWLISDEMMLTRILRNLIGNAIKFTPEGGVRVTVRTGDDGLAVEVADTGVGIGPEHQQRVFEEFYQTPGTRGGTGLGLPYALRLAKLLGGDLDLESAPGEGTTVTLLLPPGPPPPPSRELNVGHVLIVDDEDGDRRRLRELLAGSASRVSEAPDGPAALARAEADPPDLVLLDLRMPGTDGLDVLDRLPPETPVVLMTDVDLRALGDPRADRANATLDKARLDSDALREAVQRAMESTEGTNAD